jgi:cyclic pyranopterin phosphate synthase
MAIDRFGRRIHYLRISLTDHCNLRCVYCMPEEQTFIPNPELMQDDEIALLARLFAGLGFDKVRLTGGEPTVRKHIIEIVRTIASTPGIKAVSMTTNGMLLKELARPLAEAGLKRVNISIDTLDADKFQRLTRWGRLQDVWDGILAAEEAGMRPVKLNAVIVKGYNEVDVVDLAKLTIDRPWQVRFIEMMPFEGVTDVLAGEIITACQIQERIEAALGHLEPSNDGELDGESRVYHIPGARGNLGFISSVTDPFCGSCNRARLTADGRLRLCLLRENEVDLLTPLRAGASIDDLRRLILDGIWLKPWGHGLAEGVIPSDRVMSEIGG